MVLISIITPVFNNVQFIEQCIQNVLSQDYDGIEHLIMDGGSADGTVEVIKKYAENYSHISWVSEKDKGQSDAMNKGIHLAKGQYISFLNVDDYYSENTFLQVKNILTQNPSFSFIVGDCNVWTNEGKLLYVNRPRKLKTQHILSGYYFPVNPAAYFYKKEIHEKVGDYNVDNHYNMDVEFLIQASFVTNLNYFPEIWGNFRLLENTKTVSDQQNGLLEQRKKELFQLYLKKSAVTIRIQTILVSRFEYFMRKVVILKKKLNLPLDMVYWKLKKIIGSKTKLKDN